LIQLNPTLGEFCFTIGRADNQLRKFSLEFCNGGSGQKTRVMPLSEGGKSLTIFAFV